MSSGRLTANCHYSITIQGVTDLDGSVMNPFVSDFYTPFSPLWGNIDVIEMDLRGYIEGVDEHVILYYMHEASLKAYHAMKNNPAVPTPDPDKTLDEMCEEGFDQFYLSRIECYVRWKTQFDLLSNAIAVGGINSGSNKVLGDFQVQLSGSPTTAREALRQVIEPRMNECYLDIAGRQETKGAPRIRIRGCSPEAVHATQQARRYMRPGFSGSRNWDWGKPPPGFRRGG